MGPRAFDHRVAAGRAQAQRALQRLRERLGVRRAAFANRCALRAASVAAQGQFPAPRRGPRRRPAPPWLAPRPRCGRMPRARSRALRRRSRRETPPACRRNGRPGGRPRQDRSSRSARRSRARRNRGPERRLRTRTVRRSRRRPSGGARLRSTSCDPSSRSGAPREARCGRGTRRPKPRAIGRPAQNRLHARGPISRIGPPMDHPQARPRVRIKPGDDLGGVFRIRDDGVAARHDRIVSSSSDERPL